MVMLTTKDKTVCTGLLLHEGQPACFTDSTNIVICGLAGFVDPNTQRGGIKSVHTDIFVEDGETDYENPLVEKAIAMKRINIILFRVLTAITQMGVSISQVPRTEEEEVGVYINRFTEEIYVLKSTSCLFIVVLATKDTTLCTGLLLCGGNATFFHGFHQH